MFVCGGASSACGSVTVRASAAADQPPVESPLGLGEPMGQRETSPRAQEARDDRVGRQQRLAPPPGPLLELLDEGRVVFGELPFLPEVIERGAVPSVTPPQEEVSQIRPR